MGSEIKQDTLTAAFIDGSAVVRVLGRGSFKISPPLKQFIHKVVDEHSADRIVLDMSECCGMDSTFMGVLAGLACFVKTRTELKFGLINMSDKNRRLLVTLGVDKVVNYSMALNSGGERRPESAPFQPLGPGFADKLETAKTTLEAHETLVSINPENYDKFKSVLEYLQGDVRNLDRRQE